MLFVPGGLGTAGVMADQQVLGFPRRPRLAGQVRHLRLLRLAPAGRGADAGIRRTSHWACRDYLPLFGATPVEARVVVDRNRISGGGVTAGLDFGLVLLAQLLGEDIAKMTQLAMEYDPEPPFHAGTPNKAGPEITAAARAFIAPVNAQALAAARARTARP